MANKVNNAIIFENSSDLDPKAWSVMGLSAKVKEDAIGMFGTGLKMAISVLLRNGHKISIFTAGKKYDFSTQQEEFRGVNHDLIYCNGERMPFTTNLGRNWQIWQAFREIYSNCLDENGTVRKWRGKAPFATGVIVDGVEFAEIYKNKAQYICNPNQFLDVSIEGSSSSIAVVKGTGKIFYKGNLACLDSYKSIFNYNILRENSKVKLTEDRTININWNFFSYLGKGVQYLTDKRVIEKIITAKQDMLENEFKYDLVDWSKNNMFSKEFMEVVEKVYSSKPESLNESLLREFKEMNPDASIEKLKMNKCQEKMFTNACIILSDMGYGVNVPVHYIENDNHTSIAFEHKGEIYLTQRAFNTTLDLAKTLFEELAHANHGFNDCTRDFQNYIISQVFKQAGY